MVDCQGWELTLEWFLSLPEMVHRDSSSSTWYFIKAQWMTVKINSNKRKRQQACRRVESARLDIYLSASSSARIVKR